MTDRPLTFYFRIELWPETSFVAAPPLSKTPCHVAARRHLRLQASAQTGDHRAQGQSQPGGARLPAPPEANLAHLQMPQRYPGWKEQQNDSSLQPSSQRVSLNITRKSSKRSISSTRRSSQPAASKTSPSSGAQMSEEYRKAAGSGREMKSHYEASLHLHFGRR